MRKLFHVNKNDAGGFGFEWSIGQGGYAAFAKWKMRIMHRFAIKGLATEGTQKEFIARFQFGTDRDPRFSCTTLEIWNAYEARLFYFVTKIWPRINLTLAVNLGWRLTAEARKAIQLKGAIQVRDNLMRGKKIIETVNKKTGGKLDPWLVQGRKLKVV